MAISSGTPLGLTQLMSLSEVFVRQKTTFVTGNKYAVFDGDKPLLYAKEEASAGAGSALGAFFAGNARAFHMDIVDTQHKPVFHLRRPFTMGADKMEVTVGGRVVCIVRMQTAFSKRVVYINDHRDNTVLKVKGPFAATKECDFEIFTVDKRPVGVIRKQWGGLAREMFTNSDSFHIRFPRDLDVGYKCAIIGTCLFIDFLYYER